MTDNAQKCPEMTEISQNGRKWAQMVKNGKNCLKMPDNGQKCTQMFRMANNGRKWLKLPKMTGNE